MDDQQKVRLAGVATAIAFLFNTGLQVSGFQNAWIAGSLWSFAALLALYWIYLATNSKRGRMLIGLVLVAVGCAIGVFGLSIIAAGDRSIPISRSPLVQGPAKANKIAAARRWLKLADEIAATPKPKLLLSLPVSGPEWVELSEDQKKRMWDRERYLEDSQKENEQTIFNQRFEQRLEQARLEMVEYGVDTAYVFHTTASDDLKVKMALSFRSEELPRRMGAVARKLLADEGENAD
ncbi:MAG: hypothetical protein AB7F72_11075 [Afipia sp.]